MKKLMAGLAFISIFHTMNFAAGPTTGWSANPSPAWSAIGQVKEVSADLGQSGGVMFSNVRFENGECATATYSSGRPQLMVSGTDAFSLAKMQGMRAVLLTAFSTGSSVRFHWVGNYCWVDDVQLCSDATCNPLY